LVMEKSWKINVEKEGAPCVISNTKALLAITLLSWRRHWNYVCNAQQQDVKWTL